MQTLLQHLRGTKMFNVFANSLFLASQSSQSYRSGGENWRSAGWTTQPQIYSKRTCIKAV
jgi:hypothetical protein